jgi:hypothetical protein
MAFEFFSEDNDGNLYIYPMCVAFSTTSDSSGHWSVDITNAGLTHIHSVSATGKSPDNTPANAVSASVSTFSTSTVSGGVHKSQAVPALGGSPVQSAGAVTVYVTVLGDQS